MKQNLTPFFMRDPKAGETWKSRDRVDRVKIRSVSGGMVTVYDMDGDNMGRKAPMPLAEFHKKFVPYL